MEEFKMMSFFDKNPQFRFTFSEKVVIFAILL